jgi:hypothetical protein
MAYRINPNAFSGPIAPINYDIPDGLEKGLLFMPIGTEEILENYLNMYAETSIFRNTNAHSIAQEILDAQGAATYREAYDLALSVLNSQRIELNRLVNEVEIDKIDASGLTGKADCVYGKMVDNNNNINWILKNFKDGNKPSQFNLKFEMSSTLGNLTNATTATPKQSGIPNTFIIRINQNRAENKNTTLTIARTIIHEGIHARLWEFMYSRDKNLAILKNDFPGIYVYYKNYEKNWDHQQMAAHYRKTIAKGLKQFDKSQHSDEFYNALAWEGLSEIKDKNGNNDLIYTEAWKKLISAQQKKVLDIIINHKKNGSKNCN